MIWSTFKNEKDVELNSTNPTLDSTKAKLRRRRDLFHVKQSFHFFRYFYCKAILFCLLLIMALAHLLFDLLDYKCSKKWKIQATVTQGDCHSFLHKLQRVIRRAFAFCS